MDAEEIHGRPILMNGRIPPSPLHSFLKFMNSSSTKMASVVLANHGDNFKNKYYQSILDNKENLQYKYLNRSEHVKRGKTLKRLPKYFLIHIHKKKYFQMKISLLYFPIQNLNLIVYKYD